jgi:hypothetical protein
VDYPVLKLIELSGSSTVPITQGAQTGLFQSLGQMNPHTYRPNDFFANNWANEGLAQQVVLSNIIQPHPVISSMWLAFYFPSRPFRSAMERGQILPALTLAWTPGLDRRGRFEWRGNVHVSSTRKRPLS